MKQFYEIPQQAHLTIRAEGDLTLRPAEDVRLLVRCDEAPNLTMDGAAVQLLLPADAAVLMPGHLASLTLETAAGDVSARCPVGLPVTVGTVHGDLNLREAGPLQVETVYGDASLRRLHGAAQIGQVGGNLTLRHIEGAVTASCQGDLSAVLSGQNAIHLQAAGDLTLRLPEEADVAITVQAGDEVLVKRGGQSDWDGSQPLVFGEGSTPVHLQADGSVLIASQDVHLETELNFNVEAAARSVESFAGQIEQFSERIAEWAEEFAGRIADEIPRKVEMRLNAALRNVPAPPRPAVPPRPAPPPHPVRPTVPAATTSTADERLYILRMLEEGKISLEEAQTLLDALESAA